MEVGLVFVGVRVGELVGDGVRVADLAGVSVATAVLLGMRMTILVGELILSAVAVVINAVSVSW